MLKEPFPPAFDSQELRRRALRRLEERRVQAVERPEGEVRALLHELDVHRAELEVQNEELRHTQEQLSQALESYRDLFDHAPLGILVIDAGHRILQANRMAAKLCCWDLRKLEGKRIETISSPEDHGKIWLLLRSAAATGQPQTGDFRILRSSGQIRWVQAHICLADSPWEDCRVFRVALGDITSRVETEHELHESEGRLRFALDASHSGAWTLNLHDHHITRTPEYDRIFGYPEPPPNWTYDMLLDHVLPEDRPAVDARCRQAMLTPGQNFSFECRIQRGDGQVRWIEVAGEAVAAGSGGSPRLAGIVQDITQRRQSEKLAMLGQLAGSVAHEIRTPLSVIRNAVFYLESAQGAPGETMQQVLAEIRRAIRNSDQIISEMLDYLREPLGPPASFSIAAAIRQALRLVPLPGTVHLRDSTALMQNLTVCAHEDQIIRILTNLLQNATQAMPQGGELKIHAEADQAMVCIDVCDTGCGIARENLERIFEPLFTTKARGIGLGLPIAQRYARLSGGNLSVQSELGQGTTFRLVLPAAPDTMQQRRP